MTNLIRLADHRRKDAEWPAGVDIQVEEEAHPVVVGVHEYTDSAWLKGELRDADRTQL